MDRLSYIVSRQFFVDRLSGYELWVAGLHSGRCRPRLDHSGFFARAWPSITRLAT